MKFYKETYDSFYDLFVLRKGSLLGNIEINLSGDSNEILRSIKGVVKEIYDRSIKIQILCETAKSLSEISSGDYPYLISHHIKELNKIFSFYSFEDKSETLLKHIMDKIADCAKRDDWEYSDKAPIIEYIEKELPEKKIEELKNSAQILINYAENLRLEDEVKTLKTEGGKKDKENEDLKKANSEKAAKNLATLYEEAKGEIEKEIKPWSRRKDRKNFENRLGRIGKILKFLRLDPEKCFLDCSARYIAKFSEGVAHIRKKTLTILFSLWPKIFLLRALVYLIPTFLLIFHFCEFFKIKYDWSRSWFPKEIEKVLTDENVVANSVALKTSVKTSTARSETNYEKSVNYNKPDSGNKPDSYLYFHLALITIFLVAFQHLRTAIKDLNIKRNLFETYRHRVLVAQNFELFQSIVSEGSKNEVVKSAVSALFANEPSIYENRPNPTPPQAFDIRNIMESRVD